MLLPLGDQEAAVALKKRLTPLANLIALRFGAPAAFSAIGVPADTEVLLAYVWTTATPLCVASLETGKAIFIRPARGETKGSTTYL